MVRLERFELPAFWFVARRSIQLSYGRTVLKYYHSLSRRFHPLSLYPEPTKAGSCLLTSSLIPHIFLECDSVYR